MIELVKERKKEYPKFTEEMRNEYTILAPTMLPIHFEILTEIMKDYGYKIEFYEGDGFDAMNEALKSVNNDMCYPAMMVIGQLIQALKCGKYNPHKTALILSQTGGGCRASNYIHLLRKSLELNGFDYVPVISLNASGLEKHPGFELPLNVVPKLIHVLEYGDFLMYISNQCKAYEINKGDTDKVLKESIDKIIEYCRGNRYLKLKAVFKEILEDFAKIERSKEQKVKVGIVGEIYMKYSPLGNGNLEDFLREENCEAIVSGFCDFILYCIVNSNIDSKLYGMNESGFGPKKAYSMLTAMQKKMIDAINEQGEFHAPTPFDEVKDMSKGYIHEGVKMGEGWLMTAEILELIKSGVNNVVCAQPFGCLPNHIVGRGMTRRIVDDYPNANIVTIDYDPSSTKVNQENRLKLMLSNAKMAEFFEENEAN